ncbi:oxidoreductase [Coccidioides immitis RMSCC 3703]|uniref:Oxidoreductase n=1 Tax=Coccidioides immitis RMSCC 3703 TaxID=454286 RepID=A0A0J8QK24_COCIT|nr:oxidoreductase [Coccidioides immitis RMSCC 3703]
MASSGAGTGGSFQPIRQGQAQQQPGYEKHMTPTSEATKLESEGRFVEYVGSNKLKGKKALITGGDSGIGRSVAILMAREGADVTIVFLPEEQEDANDTKKAVEREGKKCLLVPGNLMNNDNCKKAVDEHVSAYDRVDVLVNNASKQIMCKDFAQIDLDNVASTFQSNILQMFAITKFAIPHMKKGSSVINTTSVVAFRGSSSMVDYSRQKELLPGPVHTPIQPASRPPEQMEGFGSGSMIGRPGQPSEIAPTFIWLASNEGALYYGQIMHPYALGD